MAYGTVNADVITTSTAGGILGAGNASIMKNRIINGAMVIDQRNAGAAITPSANTYTLDRWYYQASQASKFTIQQNAGSVTPPTGFTNYLGCTVASAVTIGASDQFLVQQLIEGFNIADLGWGTANAKTITISAWVRSSLTGTFGGALYGAAYSRGYAFTYSIPVANTWTQISVTIAGDTSGSWITNNGAGVGVVFSLGCGSSNSSTAGSWGASGTLSATGAVSVVGTAGATFYITGVQLEVGSSATGFEYRVYGTELANCQRYFWRKSGVASAVVTVGSGMAYNTTDIRCTLPNPVTMRSTPTLSFTGSNFEYEKTASSRGTLGSVDATARSVDASTLFSGSGTTATTAGQGAIWYITDSASYISISAEL
jgi:hypothetical protein